jgi:hypothetical protein
MKASDAIDAAQVAAMVVGLAAVAWLAYRATRAASDAATAAVGTITDGITFVREAPASAVLTIGDAVGVPRTNESECERAKREGRTWDASFACPAGDFLRYLWS